MQNDVVWGGFSRRCLRPCCNIFLILYNFLVNRILIGYPFSSWPQLFLHFKLLTMYLSTSSCKRSFWTLSHIEHTISVPIQDRHIIHFNIFNWFIIPLTFLYYLLGDSHEIIKLRELLLFWKKNKHTSANLSKSFRSTSITLH